MAARIARSFRGRNLVVDTSAFQRGGHEIARDEWLQALRDGRLYRTPILELEVLYSARNACEYAELRDELEALRPLQLSTAIVAQRSAHRPSLPTMQPDFIAWHTRITWLQRSLPLTGSGSCGRSGSVGCVSSAPAAAIQTRSKTSDARP